MNQFGVGVRVIHVVLLALWFGGGMMLMMIVTPDAFDVVTSKQEAGALVLTVLDHFDLFGLVAGPAILLTLMVGFMPLNAKLRLRATAAAVMTVLTGVSGRYVTPRMLELRDAMGLSVADVPMNDPMKIDFTNFSTASQWMLAVHVALALYLLITAIAATSPRRRGGFGSIEL